VLVQTVKITATVAAIDPAKRQATFQGIDGKKFTVKIGKEVANADQIQVGDKVSAIITQKVRISLDDRAPAASDTKSGASTAETMQMSARISAIDAVKRTATLRFDDGNTETVSVRDDVEFNRHKVGDQVTFRITEMIASRVERMQ
jgi:ethanolamine utilization protein EutQ (cupin superfamily)